MKGVIFMLTREDLCKVVEEVYNDVEREEE